MNANIDEWKNRASQLWKQLKLEGDDAKIEFISKFKF